jgi:hypothetical protein
MKMSGLGIDGDADGDGYNDAPSVVATALLNLANAGADWFCANCKSGNKEGRDTCIACGSPREVVRAQSSPPPKKSKFEPTPPPEPETEIPGSSYRPQWARMLLKVGLTVLSVMLIAYFFVWVNKTYIVQGFVSEKRWERSLLVDTWTPEQEREWKHEATEAAHVPPVNGMGGRGGYVLIAGSCSDEFYENERYVCGKEIEQYDCSTRRTEEKEYNSTCTSRESYSCGETCKDLGNGFAKCSEKTCYRSKDYPCKKTKFVEIKEPKTCTREVEKYCTRKVFKSKCTYEKHKWKRLRAITVQNKDERPYWPVYTPGALERVQKEEKYYASVSYVNKENVTKTYDKALQEGEYMGSWRSASPVWLRINKLGWVTEAALTPLEDK